MQALNYGGEAKDYQKLGQIWVGISVLTHLLYPSFHFVYPKTISFYYILDYQNPD
jgi:hypothetical protein